MKLFLLFWVVVWSYCPGYSQSILSGVYSYSYLSPDKQIGYQQKTLLEGVTRDFSHVIIQAITLGAKQPAQPLQQFDEEVLLIIKAGELTITLGNKQKTLDPSDVVMIMPGDDYRVDNKTDQPLTYYQLRYTSNEMPDLDLYRLVGGSFWVDWQEMTATADHPGNSRRLIPYPTVMSNRIAIQSGKIDSGSAEDPAHTHRAAEILLILDHPAEIQIDGVSKGVQAGDLIFIESEEKHSLSPTNPEGCRYVSFQF